jgi:hypothetical protein
VSTTAVQFKFVDVLGAPLDDHNVVVDVLSLDNSTHFRAMMPLRGQTDVAISFRDAATGIYRFQLAPTNYRVLQFFLRLTEDETIVREAPVIFPVDPARVSDISAPAFADLDDRLRNLLIGTNLKLDGDRTLSGADLYGAFPAILKASLLNLFTKSSHTMLGDGTTCFDHIQHMVELDQDRIFAKTDATLLEEAMQSRDFRPVDFSLHKEIAPYHVVSSFKRREAHGNLQLTFSRKGETGTDYLVDMDIDEAQGIEHVFEVIRNSVSGRTNPYNIREILAAGQNLKPLYGFVFASRGVAEATTVDANAPI